MIIKFSPQRRDDTLTLTKLGNSLTVNGEVFDFSRMSEGDTLPRSAIESQWFTGDVNVIEGELVVLIILPISIPMSYSVEQSLMTELSGIPDGPVALPQPLPELEIQMEVGS